RLHSSPPRRSSDLTPTGFSCSTTASCASRARMPSCSNAADCTRASTSSSSCAPGRACHAQPAAEGRHGSEIALFRSTGPDMDAVHAPHDRPADPRDRSVGHRQRVRQPGSGRQKGHLGPCNRAVSCGRGPGLAGTEPAAEGGAMSERILIVDDDPNSREIVQTFLESRGYHVETAEDGQAALARLEELKPSLVLLDVMMPGMDGWEVARVIKNHPDFGSTRVVMLTARS